MIKTAETRYLSDFPETAILTVLEIFFSSSTCLRSDAFSSGKYFPEVIPEIFSMYCSFLPVSASSLPCFVTKISLQVSEGSVFRIHKINAFGIRPERGSAGFYFKRDFSVVGT